MAYRKPVPLWQKPNTASPGADKESPAADLNHERSAFPALHSAQNGSWYGCCYWPHMVQEPATRERRFSWIQVCSAALLVSALLGAVVLIARPSLARDYASIDEIARPLLSAAGHWRESNPEGCPTIGGLIHEGAVSQDVVRHDPWGGPFRLVCLVDGGFALLSPGQDGRLGTEDDLEYPRR